LTGFDYVVANDMSRKDAGFSSEYNEVLILGRDGTRELTRKTLKELVATLIASIVIPILT